MPGIAHFYHVYAVGGWRDVVAEHLDAVVGSGLPIAAINLGVVGTPEAQEQACALVRSRIPVRVVARAEQGAEEITLAALWRESPPIVLYAHTKGVHVATAFNAAWRRKMTRSLVSGWRDCLPLLDGHDLVGCHWLSPSSLAAYGNGPSTPCFGGNFWWATRDWLATLGPPRQDGTRFDAETWIGGGRNPETPPRVADLNPGWPAMELFG